MQNIFKDVLNLSPEELIDWLFRNIPNEIPEEISDRADMQKASKSLLKLSGYYSYMTTLQSYAKIMTREAKRNLPKEKHEDMIDKKEIINNYTEAIKQSYQAVSRAVTIYIENNNEIRMGKEVP